MFSHPIPMHRHYSQFFKHPIVSQTFILTWFSLLEICHPLTHPWSFKTHLKHFLLMTNPHLIATSPLSEAWSTLSFKSHHYTAYNYFKWSSIFTMLGSTSVQCICIFSVPRTAWQEADTKLVTVAWTNYSGNEYPNTSEKASHMCERDGWIPLFHRLSSAFTIYFKTLIEMWFLVLIPGDPGFLAFRNMLRNSFLKHEHQKNGTSMKMSSRKTSSSVYLYICSVKQKPRRIP